jgi:hypothetical protein
MIAPFLLSATDDGLAKTVLMAMAAGGEEGSRDGGVGDDGVGDGASISESGGQRDCRTSASVMETALRCRRVHLGEPRTERRRRR